MSNIGNLEPGVFLAHNFYWTKIELTVDLSNMAVAASGVAIDIWQVD